MRYLAIFIASFTILSSSAMAQEEMQLVGKIQQPIAKPSKTIVKSMKAKQNQRLLPTSVTLLKVKLSDQAWTKIQLNTATPATEPQGNYIKGNANRVQLGMNQVPVFDQGPHSTCATFANTAAVDAALNRGDYISELCLLQLGRYLENHAYTLSGWDGSFGPIVLNQMQVFGLVNKETQRTKGCNGYTEYPTSSSDEPQTELSITDYHELSEPMPEDQVAWTPILDAYQVFIDKVDPQKTLEQVFKSLDAGDRLTFGILLFRLDQGIAGAVGKHQVNNDTWVLTPEIIQAIYSKGEVGAHEMIITGYDHDAIAIDEHGRPHKGLLTLRNSWGQQLGDQGDFYMSYDYFKTLVVEIQRIRSAN